MEAPLTAQVSQLLMESMQEFFEVNDFEPFDSNDCKELARHLRDALLERFEVTHRDGADNG